MMYDKTEKELDTTSLGHDETNSETGHVGQLWITHHHFHHLNLGYMYRPGLQDGL